jgi:poly(hydroxyalkanoate) granule-associated protein
MKNELKNTINNVWLAGLGVASLAQKETVKVYDSLIKEGKTLEKKSKKTAKTVSTKAEKRISKVRTVATEQFNKVENLFETRIESVLKKLDIPSAKDINSLSKKVDSLVKEIKSTKAA